MPLNLIVCGFLGSGKTTLIRRIVREALADRRVVVVENESGRESVDGLYLRDGGLKVVDLRAGCVCCTLRGEMAATMERIRTDFDPDCVFLEPSGLGDLADLLRIPGFEPDGVVMLVDVERFDLLLKLNRDHFLRQFRLAPVIVLTRTDLSTPERTAAVRDELERINPQALIVEGGDAFDGNWWLETVPGCYARFRAFFPVLPAGGTALRHGDLPRRPAGEPRRSGRSLCAACGAESHPRAGQGMPVQRCGVGEGRLACSRPARMLACRRGPRVRRVSHLLVGRCRSGNMGGRCRKSLFERVDLWNEMSGWPPGSCPSRCGI